MCNNKFTCYIFHCVNFKMYLVYKIRNVHVTHVLCSEYSYFEWVGYRDIYRTLLNIILKYTNGKKLE